MCYKFNPHTSNRTTNKTVGCLCDQQPLNASWYELQEALEFGRYTEAADVFSFGVLLWELYHSQTPYKKTKPGFFIRPHIFPKFEKGTPLPYAALTVACLHGDPSLRYACSLPRLAQAFLPIVLNRVAHVLPRVTVAVAVKDTLQSIHSVVRFI